MSKESSRLLRCGCKVEVICAAASSAIKGSRRISRCQESGLARGSKGSLRKGSNEAPDLEVHSRKRQIAIAIERVALS